MNKHKQTTGPGCSKLTTSLIDVLLKFQTLISLFANIFVEKIPVSLVIKL